MPEYYETHGGKILSTTIDKYMYVVLNKTPKKQFRVIYDNIEIKESAEDISHTRVRNALIRYRVQPGYEISSFCEFPTKGTGLGSSSSYTVALINALTEDEYPQSWLASEAYDIERNMCGESLGKQDQYAAAFGGMNLIEFSRDATNVTEMPDDCRADLLQDNLMMFYTGIRRDANDILSKQATLVRDHASSTECMSQMVDMVDEGVNLLKRNRFADFGSLIGKSWDLKKRVNRSVTNDLIDESYESAIKAGAIGGKLLGAGGGGFLMFYVERGNQQAVRDSLKHLSEFKFNFEHEGAKVVFKQ